MSNQYLRVEYTDKQGKEVLLSQNAQSGGIMVSEKRNGEYQCVFSSFSGVYMFVEEKLINWYETDYQELKALFADELANNRLVKQDLKTLKDAYRQTEQTKE